jgi:hypothetical protein
MARVILSIGAGALADILSWPAFFTLTALACLPCIILLMQAPGHFLCTSSFLKKAPQV